MCYINPPLRNAHIVMHAAKMSKLCVSAQWLRKLALASCQPDGNLLCARLTPVIHSKFPPPSPPSWNCLRLLRNTLGGLKCPI